MFWLRDRGAHADGGTHIGWIARLGRALARWLSPGPPTSHGNPPRVDPPAPGGSDPDGARSQPPSREEANANEDPPSDMTHSDARTDSPPPVVKTSGSGPDHPDAVECDLPARVEPPTPDVLHEGISPPVDQARPESDIQNCAPGDPAEPVEAAIKPTALDRRADRHATQAKIESGVPATQPASGSAAVPEDAAPKGIQDLAPGSNKGQPPSPPPATDGLEDKASPNAQAPNGESALDAAQPVQEVEDACPQAPAASSERDHREDRDDSGKRSADNRSRKQPDNAGKAPRYRPNLRPPPAQAPPREASASPKSPDSSRGTLEALYRISFLPGGLGLTISVLLGRVDGMPESLNVDAGGHSIPFHAIDETLYEPIEPLNADLIAEGFVAETQEDPSHRWVRSARDLHAFSQRTGVAGFVSVPRVLIGQENVVLCRAELATTVQQCASSTGSDPLVEVSGPGVPDGWHCFRGYRPMQQGDFTAIDDLFLALNPHLDASIQLSGGIDSARGRWVPGAPPVIRVLGAILGPDELTIDGKPATESADQGWTAPGWDTLGTHTVRFAGLSRKYEIAEIEEDWPSWSTSEDTSLSACGARVADPNGVQAMAFADGPCWLVGASAGDLALAERSIHGTSIAAPSFPPVWALPPISSGRQSPAIALAHGIPPKRPASMCSRHDVIFWCQLVRAAGPPSGAAEGNLWRDYRKLARSLRRSLR